MATLSSNGRCFDVGNAVRQALERYNDSGEPFSGSTDPYAAGNGSIMRLAPVVLAYYPNRDFIWHYAAESFAHNAWDARMPGRLPPVRGISLPRIERGGQGRNAAEHRP